MSKQDLLQDRFASMHVSKAIWKIWAMLNIDKINALSLVSCGRDIARQIIKMIKYVEEELSSTLHIILV